MNRAKTLGELKKSKYQSRSIHEEIRTNLIAKISNNENSFNGIHGYDNSVIPDVERALLSGHNILFLGLRGQAKTRMARLMTDLLDEYIPVVSGSEINDDPLNPISKFAKETILKLGDKTPIHWLHRNDRYVEKLATPDVNVADLLGDIDPIKAATKKLEFSDEYSIHYGLIPRSNRSVFVINELPDLQNRIQVALFNILEENDIQIRGFKLKLPLNILFVFTANPEDYTQRGNIITPLKDRIQSQILTHYPESIETALKITLQEVSIPDALRKKIYIPFQLLQVIEQLTFSARDSELVDQKSGVSARLSISALELLYSAIERRMLLNKEIKSTARLCDLLSIVPAITGKIELVYEGEQMGAYEVAMTLINDAILKIGKSYFPKMDSKKKSAPDVFALTTNWFTKGNDVNVNLSMGDKAYAEAIQSVPIDKKLFMDVKKEDILFMTEFLLHYIASNNTIQKEWMDQRIFFKDPLAGMLNDLNLQ
ncbi:MAG: magnesium chelatase [Saprospiraceae bacterium]|nr:magnesium chelatase [Saprospiraceae bacterium]